MKIKTSNLMNPIVLLYVFFLMSPQMARAKKIYINIGQAQVKKSLIALTPLNYYGSFQSSSSAIKTGQEIYSVLRQDLDIANYFKFIDPKAFLEDPKKIGLKPKPTEANGFDYNKWKAIGTDFLIRAGYKILNSQIELDAYVYYVPQGQAVFGRTYKSSTSNLRSLAHRLSDDVIFTLTGKKGIFNTKIAFTSDRENKSRVRSTEVFIMDWDAHPSSIKRVTYAKSIALTHGWSPKGDKIAFTNFAFHPKAKTRNPDLFIYNLKSGKTHLLAYKRGTNSGATFHPNGRELFYTFAKDGRSNIFKINLISETKTNITRYHPKNTLNLEPHISPDGQLIVYSSTRSKNPMIYIMNKDGSRVRRRTFAGWYNASPRFSPDGKKIVFAGQDKSGEKGGYFDIFTINIDGTNMQRLTSARKKNGKMANNEEPSFSPDGRKVMFTSDRTGKNQIFIIDIDGTNERQITSDNYNYYRPRWSPYLNE